MSHSLELTTNTLQYTQHQVTDELARNAAPVEVKQMKTRHAHQSAVLLFSDYICIYQKVYLECVYSLISFSVSGAERPRILLSNIDEWLFLVGQRWRKNSSENKPTVPNFSTLLRLQPDTCPGARDASLQTTSQGLCDL